MTHPTKEKWMAYLYGELDPKEQREFKAHLEQCSECKADVAAWRGVMSRLDTWQLPRPGRYAPRLRQTLRWATRWAVAAVLLIAVGYCVGGISAYSKMEVEELRQELDRDWQVAFANGYVQLRDELTGQFSRDLNDFAVQILAASGVATNQRLVELIEAINAAQTQDRRWIAAALEQIELNRIEDSTRLRDDLATFAVLTEDELLRTKQDVAKLVAFSLGDSLILDESEKPEPLK